MIANVPAEIGWRLYRRRYLIWGTLFFGHSMLLFHRMAMATVADRLMADFSISATAFGALTSVYFYIYAAMQLPSGTLADTLGPRKTITAGLLVSALGTMLMGLSPSFGVLYLSRFLIGLGVSVIWVSVLRALIEWFRAREFATVSGIEVMLGHIGQIAATTPLALLVVAVGWRMSMEVVAMASVGMAVVTFLVVRDNPRKAGLPSIAEMEARGRPLPLAFPDPPRPSIALRIKGVVGNKYLWPLFLFGAGSYGAFATFFTNYSVVYLMQLYGMERSTAASYPLVATIGFMVGSLVLGLLSDRVMQRRRLPAVLLHSILLVSFLALTLWGGGRPPQGALYPLCFLIGFGGGGGVIVFAEVRDLVHPSVRGISLGLVNTGNLIGVAVMGPLFGYILDLGWQGQMVEGVRLYSQAAFQHGLILLCGCGALGLLGVALMKETRCRDLFTSESKGS